MFGCEDRRSWQGKVPLTRIGFREYLRELASCSNALLLRPLNSSDSSHLTYKDGEGPSNSLLRCLHLLAFHTRNPSSPALQTPDLTPGKLSSSVSPPSIRSAGILIRLGMDPVIFLFVFLLRCISFLSSVQGNYLLPPRFTDSNRPITID
jgi:hypothetical protein